MKRIFQIFISLVRNLEWRAVSTFLSHPLYAVPTVWATVESIYLSEKNFENNPSGNGLANAFRHSSWNLLIAHYGSKISKTEKALNWSKKITDLHEEIFQNAPFDREMDLHNNAVGRAIFEEAIQLKIKSKNERLKLIIKKTQTAVALTDENEFRNHKHELVYFSQKS